MISCFICSCQQSIFQPVHVESDLGIDVPPKRPSAFRTTSVDAGMNLAEWTCALSSARQTQNQHKASHHNHSRKQVANAHELATVDFLKRRTGRGSVCISALPDSPMLSRKPALVGNVYMLVLTAVLTKKLWIGDIVPLYALAAAVCSVQALSAVRFFNSSEIKETDDSSLCKLREQLFFVVTVPAYKAKTVSMQSYLK